MKMLLSLLITAGPECKEVYRQAMAFCTEQINRGHRINQIFFMHDANYMAVHADADLWSNFAKRHQIELQTCGSTADHQSIALSDYAAGFQQGGLSSLADSILNSDNIFQFGSTAAFEALQSNANVGLSVASEKKVTFVFETQPEQDSLSEEGLNLLLVLGAFEADIHVVFRGDGVQNIQNNNDAPRYVKRFKALADFGIEHCYLEEELADATVQCEVVSNAAVQQLVETSRTLHF